MKALCLMVRKLCFPDVGQRSRSCAQHVWYHRKGLVIMNTHATYESPIFKGKKVISKPKNAPDGQTYDGQSDP